MHDSIHIGKGVVVQVVDLVYSFGVNLCVGQLWCGGVKGDEACVWLYMVCTVYDCVVCVCVCVVAWRARCGRPCGCEFGRFWNAYDDSLAEWLRR